jgi:hypothetical protein
MKKILLSLLSFSALLSSYMVTAQTFTTQADTVYINLTDQGGTFYNDITAGAQDIDIQWQITSYSMPQAFADVFGICDASLCRNNSVGTYDLFTGGPYSTIGAPYTAGHAKDFHVVFSANTAAPGNGYVTVHLLDKTSSNPSNKDITFIVNKYPTGISTAARPDANITLYPNPAKNELNVLFNPDADVKIISVYNLIGRAVSVYRLTSNNSAKLNLENIPTGVYFLRMMDSKGQVIATRKFTHQ